MNRHFILFALAFAAALSGFAKTFDVDISTGRPAASNEAYYHGETIEFRAVRGKSVVTNIEYSCVYYQTNGMDSVWWRTDGLTFHPTNDVGAASYRFFMEGRDDLGRDWHANGLLRLLPSPGFEPNTLEHPVLTLDFSGIEVLNAPWTEPDFSTNNTELVDTIQATAPAPGDYAAVSNRAVNAISRAEAEAGFTEWVVTPSEYDGKSLHIEWVRYEFDGMIFQGWVIVDSDGEERAARKDYPTATNLVWVAADTNIGAASATRTRLPTMADATLTPIYSQTPTYSEWIISPSGKFIEVLWLNHFAEDEWEWTFSFDGYPLQTYNDDRNATSVSAEDYDGTVYTATRTRTRTDIIGYTLGSQTNDVVASTNGIGRTAQLAEAATTTNALQDAAISTLGDSISTLADEAAPAINGYARLYSFITGSTNANIVVTNYQLTAEAEAERTHYDPSDPDLDFSTVPPSLRLEDASSGTNRVVVDTRDWTVWYFAQKIGGAMAEAVSTAIDTCRAWCGFTATGLENPVPDTLVVDVPNIWLMAGKTFEKHIAGSNAVWIIRSSGVVMPISDNSQSAGGFLELTDAFGAPYIRFNKTESYFVDPAADGVEYDSATGAWLVTYTTASCPKGGANAVLEGSTTYPGKAILKDEDDPDCPATITWTGSANNWVMHAVPKQIDGAVPPKMFFAAVVEVQGQDYIEYLRPMSIPHLLVDGVKIAPEIPASHPAGTTVSWKVVQ